MVNMPCADQSSLLYVLGFADLRIYGAIHVRKPSLACPGGYLCAMHG